MVDRNKSDETTERKYMANKRKQRMQWYQMDLHIHTPASHDYLDRDMSYIDILRRAEQRGVDIIAFTDHNTVNGYAAMMQEIDRLTFLEQSGRALADELRLLAEYRRLLDKVLVLPGFEFTATFGFHILGIFAPETPIRYMEHLLLSLNVPPDVLERGDGSTGATDDVLTAYQTIANAGGLAIAAHANSNHGVAMRGIDFGGQTRIAYTQDKHLHGLELTDLGRKGRGSSQRFFNGTKPEYPRRMHCIQGSDAHSLDTVQERKHIRYGVGERVTEIALPDRSFQAIYAVFQGTDFSRTRPYTANRQPLDYIMSAREEGPSIVQSFHESYERKGGKLGAIVSDVCAFANTNGGTVYVGVSSDTKKKPNGITDVQDAIETIQQEISGMITPSLNIDIDAQETQGKTIIRILVPYGEDRPYAIDNQRIFVRDETDTNLAVRDEIVNLVQQGLVFRNDNNGTNPQTLTESAISTDIIQTDLQDENYIQAPQAGVEIVAVEKRDNTRYYTMQDLRNGNIVRNVTRSSARKLWDYAIKQWEGNPVRDDKVRWQGAIGLWREYRKSNNTRYDLVQKIDGGMRVYYGVTENGMNGAWEVFLAPEDSN